MICGSSKSKGAKAFASTRHSSNKSAGNKSVAYRAEYTGFCLAHHFNNSGDNKSLAFQPQSEV